MRLNILVVALALVTACTTAIPDPSPTPGPEADLEDTVAPTQPLWPPVPDAPTGALDQDVSDGLDRLIPSITAGSLDADALDLVAGSRDARLAWLISDMLRFTQGGLAEQALAEAFTELTGVDPRADDRFGAITWLAVTNLLIGWDLPAPPDYRERKADLFIPVEPAWEPFFADEASAIDWRWVSWGGVLIDDRPSGDRDPCPRGCIPSLDDPTLTSAADGDWYADDRTIFGVVVNGEAVAFPKHIMEVHEMVNLTIGERRIGMPYCTLCGSAQAFLTDAVPDGVETPVLRTSGLLSRSNKVMYDLVTDSVFNTFTGRAISGRLHDDGIVLEPTTVVVTTWGEWKGMHPDTRIVAEDGGIGRSYPDDPLGGRDDDGPIFPIGQVDPRLPAQSQVLGVIDPDAGPVAFGVEQAEAELMAGGEVRLESVEVIADAGGLRARLIGGDELPAHQAFWFAWSQFHPDTAVWSGTFTEDVAQASPRSETDAYAARMCEALAELPELEPQLNVLREGAVEAVDSIAEARASLRDARRLVAAAGPWPSGAAFRQAMLDSLDQIDAQLRAAAASASDGGAFGDTLAAIPFITTDRVEVELQQVIESGFRC
ncbi:MAG: DUF3179 domain-containing protein [Chloroflexota bacterium]|nr:DUF3179 domain-containing protein [Chloroflexota bacterium]